MRPNRHFTGTCVRNGAVRHPDRSRFHTRLCSQLMTWRRSVRVAQLPDVRCAAGTRHVTGTLENQCGKWREQVLLTRRHGHLTIDKIASYTTR